ncbi:MULTISPECIES: hypothetical protein [Pseudomonas aeruginosa group]|uniref:hypothetical protein n=1 Tax=Pseudomonas aeruginosa group TaxID=136841 RepID=UPI0010FB5251|nr:hypothetical protein [Pseudomonas aeruginosa]MCW8362078.1 hypothetical protein [Pseudomonas aeruginosa]MCW8368476.1 hypothetical protein [Pseudomonas aeruginosa]MCW8415555.1 hypothetical protein [Pseudomonas aeruginosa]NTT31471.1 hypothetical protein [Pseudomonas aeruginosa]HCF0757219.1 hypothetical protein [Pseudomonas aeruginosa]
MLKQNLLIILVLLTGCASAESGHTSPSPTDPDLAALHVDEDGPVLKAYPMSARNNESAQLQKAAALLDYQVASADCLRAQNFYEARSKSSEGARLGVGVIGGVAGFVGSMLAAAGTGGVWPGVSAGIAGVASTTLGAAEKGPLAPSAYAANREFVAKAMAVSSAKLPTLSSAEEIYLSAVSLQGTCAAPNK